MSSPITSTNSPPPPSGRGGLLPGECLHDGLADEHGPIPAFGPARTDSHGRVVMGDDEWEARRAAAVRALEAVAGIADETDTDEVWDEVFRGLEEARRWRDTSSSTANPLASPARPEASRGQTSAALACRDRGNRGAWSRRRSSTTVRRELVRVGATAGLRRLDALLARFPLLLLDRPALLRAADLWALVRRAGVPTADPHAAGRRRNPGGSGSGRRRASQRRNHRHWKRSPSGAFPAVDARTWSSIT